MMGSLLLILGVSLFAFSSGAQNCEKPCADLWVAKDCNTVQYCIKNEWSKLKPTGKTDNVCDICLRMVKEARDVLQSKETEDELKQVFEGSCKLLTVLPIVEMCDKLADEFVPQLVAILSSQMDPETVCTVAKLCNNYALRESLKKSNHCTDCQKFMVSAREKMKSVSEAEYEEGLLALCRTAGSFTDACYAVTKMHSGLLYNHTKMALEGTPCEATFLCPSGAGTEMAANDKCLITSRKRMCPMCLKVTEDIVEQLTRTKSVEDYLANFVKICTGLRFPRDFCTDAAKSSRMYNFLKENGKAVSRFFCYKTICEEKRTENIPVWPLLPVQLSAMSIEDTEEMIMRLLVDFIRENGEEHIPFDMKSDEEVEPCEESVKSVSVPVDCQTCELILKKVTQVIEDEKKEDVVKRSLSEVCNKLSKQSQEKCLSIVTDHDKTVHDVILQHTSPDAACRQMKYCPQERKVTPVKSLAYGDPIENPIFFAPVVFNPVYQSDCKTCKDLSHVLSDYVNTNNTYMKQALGVACLLSKNLGKCSKFIESYSPDVAKSFAEYVSSEKVCQDVIPSCEAKEIRVTPKKESANLCQDCKTWVEGVTSILLDDKNLEMIRATFGMVCERFSKEQQDHCRYIVKRDSERILSNILERLTPDEACGGLNYCPKRELEVKTVPSVTETSYSEEINSSKVPCKFCLLAVKTLLDQLENDKTEAAIRNALKHLCQYFPEETRQTCQNLIDEYAEDLVDMIIADFDPSEICIRLRMCKPVATSTETNELLIKTFDIRTNEVRDDEEVKRLSGLVSTEPEPEKALLDRVHSAVQECALCEALVQVISSHKQMLVKDYNFSGNAAIICRIVPRYKRKQCMSMVVSYGPSIVNLIVDQKVTPDQVCLKLTLCDSSMNAKIDMPVSVPEPFAEPADDDCLKGPNFWCANEENARKCGTYLHCREMVWKTEKTLN